MHITFSFAFSSRYAKTRNSNFRKVVRQHIESMVWSIIWVLLEICFCFQQWKNLGNPLRIDKVIATSLVYCFFGTQCILSQYYPHWTVLRKNASILATNLIVRNPPSAGSAYKILLIITHKRKKLSYRREAAQCSVLLKILLSLKVIRNHTVE